MRGTSFIKKNANYQSQRNTSSSALKKLLRPMLKCHDMMQTSAPQCRWRCQRSSKHQRQGQISRYLQHQRCQHHIVPLCLHQHICQHCDAICATLFLPLTRSACSKKKNISSNRYFVSQCLRLYSIPTTHVMSRRPQTIRLSDPMAPNQKGCLNDLAREKLLQYLQSTLSIIV